MFQRTKQSDDSRSYSLIRRLGVAWLACWTLLGSSLILGAVAPHVGSPAAASRSAARGDLHAADHSLSLPKKNIEDIVPGDIVLAEDETTGELAPKRVVQVFRNVTDHLRIVRIRSSDGVEQELQTTDEHPFYVEDSGWIAAKELAPGVQLVAAAGHTATVVSSIYEPHPEGLPVYNFEVEDFHTYFVSKDGSSLPVLVHNKCVNANSRSSRRPNHGYEIYETSSGNTHKFGVSSSKTGASGKSPRAESQVRKLNEMAGYEKYGSKVSEKFKNRAKALDWEAGQTTKYRDANGGVRPPGMQRP